MFLRVIRNGRMGQIQQFVCFLGNRQQLAIAQLDRPEPRLIFLYMYVSSLIVAVLVIRFCVAA